MTAPYAGATYGGSDFTYPATADPYRRGLGLVLDSAAVTHTTPPVTPLPSPPPGSLPPPVEHITTPTVPAPVLLNGRPT